MTMTDTPCDNGVNVQALLDARNALVEAPEAAQFTWKASTEWKGGTHSYSEVTEFFGLGGEQAHRTTFGFDADHPEVFASEDHGATPVEFVLVGLASCLTAGVAAVAQNRGIQLPILLRFTDILQHRVGEIAGAFGKAIDEYGYQGKYACVYPIKVNQQRHVVEEVLNFGKPYGFGLEAGSKPELLAVLALTLCVVRSWRIDYPYSIDFQVYWLAGKRVAHGEGASLYAAGGGPDDGTPLRMAAHEFKNVPLVAWAFAPFASLPYLEAKRAFWWLSLACLVAGGALGGAGLLSRRAGTRAPRCAGRRSRSRSRSRRRAPLPAARRSPD